MSERISKGGHSWEKRAATATLIAVAGATVLAGCNNGHAAAPESRAVATKPIVKHSKYDSEIEKYYAEAEKPANTKAVTKDANKLTQNLAQRADKLAKVMKDYASKKDEKVMFTKKPNDYFYETSYTYNRLLATWVHNTKYPVIELEIDKFKDDRNRPATDYVLAKHNSSIATDRFPETYVFTLDDQTGKLDSMACSNGITAQGALHPELGKAGSSRYTLGQKLEKADVNDLAGLFYVTDQLLTQFEAQTGHPAEKSTQVDFQKTYNSLDSLGVKQG